jgi:hypothetical protein
MFQDEQWISLVTTLTKITETGDLEWTYEEILEGYRTVLDDTEFHLYNQVGEKEELELLLSEKQSGDSDEYLKVVDGINVSEYLDFDGIAGTDSNNPLLDLWNLIERKIAEPDEKFEAMIRDEKFNSLMDALNSRKKI